MTNEILSRLDFLWLEVTQKCNLGCVHCYADATPSSSLFGKMTLEDWERTIDEAFVCGCRKVQFIGGDPTLHPGLPRLIGHAAYLGYDFIEVFTNGTILKESLKEKVISHRVHLAFSLYASDPSIHDEITQRNGSYVKTIETIKWAVESGVSVRVCITEMPLNCDVIEETKRFLNGIGVSAVRIDRVRGIGRGIGQAKSTDPLKELCGNCWKRRLCVTASGDIYPCIMARAFPVGRQEQGLHEANKGVAIMRFRQLQTAHLHVARKSSYHNCAPDEWCGPEQICGPEEGCSPELCGPEEDDGKDDDNDEDS